MILSTLLASLFDTWYNCFKLGEIIKGGVTMPWDMKDYPDSMKNMDTLLRKKAIDIANALEAQGYDDGRAIPIAHAQAQEWFENASVDERKEFEDAPDPKKDDTHDKTANSDLIDNDVKVFYEEEQWKVQTVGAKQPSQTFDYKADAVERAEEMAKNKESNLLIYKQDGELQTKRKP